MNAVSETARERRDCKRLEAKERNAKTPDALRRAARAGGFQNRPTEVAPSIDAAPVRRAEPAVRATRPDFPRLVAATRAAHRDSAVVDPDERAERRRAAYQRRAAPRPGPKRRPSDVARPRLTDGLKADHEARRMSADAIAAMFALPHLAASNLVRSAEEEHAEAALPLTDQSVASASATDRSVLGEQVALEPTEAASEINDRSERSS